MCCFLKVNKRYFEIRENSRDNVMAVIKVKDNNKTNDIASIIQTITVLVIDNDAIPFFAMQQVALRQNGLKYGRQYDVTFSKETIIKIGSPYKPKCVNYHGEFAPYD